MKKKSSARGPRILIVDDHGISRQFIASVLRRGVMRVGEARSADEAVSIALSWLPHVVLMDVSLAGECGYAAAHRIKTGWPADRPLPRIVMLSADPPKRHPPHVRAAGADGFLLKPFSAGQLLDAVSTHGPPGRSWPSGGEPSLQGLQELFRTELAARLAPLERALARRDLPTATGILHQLIASSALCRQRRLERDLRALHEACYRGAKAAELARPYFSLLGSAQEYLASG